MGLHLRVRREHVRHGRRLPSLAAPVDWDAMLILQPLAAAFGCRMQNVGQFERWIPLTSDTMGGNESQHVSHYVRSATGFRSVQLPRQERELYPKNNR